MPKHINTVQYEVSYTLERNDSIEEKKDVVLAPDRSIAVKSVVNALRELPGDKIVSFHWVDKVQCGEK